MRNRCALVAAALALAACGDNLSPNTGALRVSPTTGLSTDESGMQATFTIALADEPDDEVVIEITSSDPAEGTPSPTTLIFDVATYATPQTVTITGVDDPRVDGNRPYAIRIASGTGVSSEVTVTNLDNDVASVTVSPVAGLMTTEGGAQATFDVALTSQPSSDVTVPVSSTDPGEGTVSAATLTFTPTSWNIPQTVTVTGVQDSDDDGAVGYTIALGATSSSDLVYQGLDPEDVQVTNADDDVPGIAVTQTTGLITTEAGGQATFQIVLQGAPTADVTIGVSSSATDEATVSTAQVVFTTTSWNTPQTVTVTGVDDDVDDDNQPFTIVLAAATSTDPTYAGVDPTDVTGNNIDDDAAGVIVEPTSGLVTSESGGTDAFSVRLASEPTGVVTIGVTSTDTSEGTVAVTSLVFDASSWDTPQIVTVTGVNDALTDGDQPYAIQLAAPTSSDTLYAALLASQVSATNTDDDVPGFTIDPTSLFVSEFGDFETFTVVLNTAPTADVTITLTSADTTEGTVSPATLTFTPQNWNTPQTVTVTGVDDALADGNVSFAIITGVATSSDAGYAGIDPPDVTVTNVDGETAQVYVKARRQLTVSEGNQSATFRVRLTLAPTATVTCPLASSDPTEGTVSPTTLTFQPNQFGFQLVTIDGVDDTIDDGDIDFTIVLGACTSTDPQYNGSNPRDVTAVNRDND